MRKDKSLHTDVAICAACCAVYAYEAHGMGWACAAWGLSALIHLVLRFA